MEEEEEEEEEEKKKKKKKKKMMMMMMKTISGALLEISRSNRILPESRIHFSGNS